MDNLIKQKKAIKKVFSEKLSFSYGVPLIAVILDKELSKKELSMVRDVLTGASNLETQVIVLADSHLNSHFSDLAIVLPYSRRNRKYLLEAADMAIGFEFSDVEEMLLNGVIPVSCKKKELSDYHPNHETGNSFIYTKTNSWSIFAALVRAVETFKFPYDWQGIVRHGLSCEVSV